MLKEISEAILAEAERKNLHIPCVCNRRVTNFLHGLIVIAEGEIIFN